MMRTETDQERLNRITDIVTLTSEGLELMSLLNKNNVSIKFSDQPAGRTDTFGACYINSSHISFDPPYKFTILTPRIELCRDATDAQLVMSLLHEGKHAEQCLRGTHPLYRYMSNEDYVSYVRFTEADASSFTIVACMKLAKITENAEYLFHSLRTELDHKAWEKLMTAFNEKTPDLADLDAPSIKSAFFNSWFHGGQMNQYDSLAYHASSSSTAVSNTFRGKPPVPVKLTDEELKKVCDYQGGNYLDAIADADFFAQKRYKRPAPVKISFAINSVPSSTPAPYAVTPSSYKMNIKYGK